MNKTDQQPADKPAATPLQPSHRAIMASPLDTAMRQADDAELAHQQRRARKRKRPTILAGLWTALVLSVLSVPTVLAATVTGTITDSSGTATNITIRFEPLSNPQAEGGYIFTSLPVSMTATNGVFSVRLEQGDYAVMIGGRDTFEISVPNDSLTHNIQDLITTQLTYVYAQPPSRTIATGQIATDTTPGFVLLASSEDSSVVFGTNRVINAITNILATVPVGDGLTNDVSVIRLALTAGTNLTFVTNTGVISINSTNPVGDGLTNDVSVIRLAITPGTNIVFATNTGLITISSTATGTGTGTGSVMNVTTLTNDMLIVGAGTADVRATNALGARTILGVSEWTTNAPFASAGYALVSDGAGGLTWQPITVGSVATPVFVPNGSTFATSQEISITCATVGAAIHFTTNGATPTAGSPVYSAPFTVETTTTAKALAILSPYTDSAVASATFTKTWPVYYGKSASVTLDESGVTNLTAVAKTSATATYSISDTDNEYVYFATLAAWSTPLRLTISGLDVSLAEADPYDNAFGSLWYAPVTIDGNSYRLFRSYNTLPGALDLKSE